MFYKYTYTLGLLHLVERKTVCLVKFEFQISNIGHIYTKKLFITCLKHGFNWASHISSDNLNVHFILPLLSFSFIHMHTYLIPFY